RRKSDQVLLQQRRLQSRRLVDRTFDLAQLLFGVEGGIILYLEIAFQPRTEDIGRRSALLLALVEGGTDVPCQQMIVDPLEELRQVPPPLCLRQREETFDDEG